MPDIFCYGASGHGKVVADIVAQAAAGRVVGFVDDDPAMAGAMLDGLPVIGPPGALGEARVRDALFIVTIGRNDARLRAAATLSAMGAAFATAVHPRACIAPGVVLGPGTVVMAGGIINSGAVLGAHVIVNTGATVDHDCVLDDGVHVSPGANLAGGVRAGLACHIGIGAAVIQGIRLGAGSVAGAGAVVIRDVDPGRTVAGNPAAAIRKTREQVLRDG